MNFWLLQGFSGLIPNLANYFLSDKIVKIKIQELGSGINGRARVGINGEELKLDDDFIQSNSIRRIAGVIGHELAHNYGFRHTRYDFGNVYYPFTVPEQVEACVCTGRPNSKRILPTITNIKQAFVELYDDAYFNDRRLTIRANKKGSSSQGHSEQIGRSVFIKRKTVTTW